MLIVRLTGDIGTGVRPCVRICWTAAEYLTLLDLIYINGWLYIYLFHSSVLHLFNDYCVTIVDIQSLLRGLAGETAAVEVKPVTSRDLARTGVERADGGGRTVSFHDAHDVVLWQVVGSAALGSI